MPRSHDHLRDQPRHSKDRARRGADEDEFDYDEAPRAGVATGAAQSGYGYTATANGLRAMPARPKPLPRPSTLRRLGIDVDDFKARHRVVTCPHCEADREARAFMMLVYVCKTPGLKRVIMGFRQIARGKMLNSQGQERVNWLWSPQQGASCDEGHECELDPQTGEVKFYRGE